MLATITENIQQSCTLSSDEIEEMNLDLMQTHIHFHTMNPKPESPLFFHFIDQILEAVVETATILNYDSKIKANQMPILFGSENQRAHG
jgi:hypothetical protein